jgi:hypothetical protein
MPKALVWRIYSGTRLYQKGDVISVVPDDHEFSQAAIDDNHTTVIDFQGIDLAKAKQLLEKQKRPAVEGEPEFDAPDEQDRFVYSGKNKWYFASIADKKITAEEINTAIVNREGSGLFTETEAGTYG